METEMEPSGALLMDLFRRLESNKEIFFHHVKTLGDVLESREDTVHLDNTIKEVVVRMGELGLDAIPVVDIAGSSRKNNLEMTYVGIVRNRDIAAVVSSLVGGISQQDSDEEVMQLRLANLDAIDRRAEVVTRDTTLFDAMELMLKNHVETVAVVDSDRKYVGSFDAIDAIKCFTHLTTIRSVRTSSKAQEVRLIDLFSRQGGGGMPSDRLLDTFIASAKDIMDDEVKVISGTSSVDEAMALMEKDMCHRLIVVDEVGNLKGITSSTSIQLALPPVFNKSQPVQVKGRGIFKTVVGDLPEERQVRAGKVMAVTNTQCQTVDMEQPVVDIAAKLLGRESTDMPVMDSGNVIKGIVGRREMMKALVALGGVLKQDNPAGG